MARLQALEDRLGAKRREAAEKGAVLAEVARLTDALRLEAADARGARAEGAARAARAQRRLRGVTARIMAAISELSLYQVRACFLGAWVS